jgi:tetratricopeptide (TPR) repeat protein
MRRGGALVLAALLACAPALGQAPAGLEDGLYQALRAAPDPEAAAGVESRLWAVWSASGSATIDALLARADALGASEEPERAGVLHDDIVRLAPGFAEGWNRRAAYRFAEGDLSGAFADLSMCLRLNQRHFGAWLGAGVILEEWGEHEKALAAYREALALHPTLSDALRGARRMEAVLEGVRA